MDRKGLTVLIFAVLLLLGVNLFVAPKVFPPKLILAPSTNQLSGNLPASGNNGTIGTSVTALAPRSSADPTNGTTGAPAIDAPRRPEQLLSLTNSKVRFVMTSHGGALKQAAMVEHKTFIPCRTSPSGLDTNALLTLNLDGPTPVLGFEIGSHIDGNGDYELTALSGGGVRAEKILPNGLAIVREFRLSTNEYLLNAKVRIENRGTTDLALPAQDISIGTATPMNGHDKGDALGVDWLSADKYHNEAGWISIPGFLCMPTSARNSFTATPEEYRWAAVHNQFFALATLSPNKPDKITGTRIPLPQPSEAALQADRLLQTDPMGVATYVTYPAMMLAKSQTIERTFTLYAGPKNLRTLSELGHELERVMGYGWFGIFASPLLLGMNFLHGTFGLGYGWCIVLITVLIRGAFWPLMAMSTRSSKKMAELQPRIKALQEKYKDDPKKQSEKMAEVWRESGGTPLLGCLPLFVTFPVFIGFFTMLRSAIELRGMSFLWCCDLSAADTLMVIPGLGFLPLIGVVGLGLPFNVMPLLYVGTGLWMNHTMPMAPQMDPVQQRLIRWMPVFFLFLFYNYSAGLTVYWTTNNLLTILQNKLTKTKDDKSKGTLPAKEVKVRS